MENKERKEIQQVIPVKIIREKKQLSVRFPKAIEDRFDINPEKDGFIWIVEGKENLSLSGALIVKGKENEK